MALALQDRVQETTTTAGTGTITLAGAVIGYQTFAAVGDGNTTYYCIAGSGTTEWEVGIGTYTLSGTTLSRTTVLASSNGGSLVTFSAGSKSVFVTYPAEKSVNLDAAGNASALGTPVSFVGTNITGTAASLTAGAATALATARTIAGVSFNGTANIAIPIGNLSDVVIDTPLVNQLLGYNGTNWINTNAPSAGAGAGVVLYNATPVISALGTQSNVSVATLASVPIVTAEQTATGTAASNTILFSAFISGPLNRTIIDAGVWDFTNWIGVNSAAGSNKLTRQVYTSIPFVTGTVTMTGTGTSRTATASAGTPFATAVIDASATNTTASYLQTPAGLYQITARTSDTVVTIGNVPTTYTNETAVAGTVLKKLFGITTPEINNITPDYGLYEVTTTAASYAITTATGVGILGFFVCSTTHTITVTYNGTEHNTHVNTPLVNVHNELAGLNGGTSNEYYHSTLAEYTGTGTGVFVRDTNPILVTPALGTPTALVGTNITGTATAFTASNVTTNANLTGGVTSVGNAATVVTNANLTGGVTSVGNAATVITNANLTGGVTSVGNATTVVTNANLTGGVTSVGNAATVITNANLTGGVTSVGNAATVVTNANLTGEATSVGNAATLTNSAVIGKVLTGYVSGAGTVAATDTILQAIQKLNGNDATNANLTGVITSVGNATSIASQTGTGTKFVVDTSPILVTPNLGTPTAVVLTSGTGLPLTTGVTGTLPIGNGGTNITTYTTGDILYASATNVLSKLAAGSNTNVLTLTAGVPAWTAPAGGGAALSNDTTTATNVYPVFAAATSGTPTTVYTSNANLLYKPSTGEFQASVPVALNGLFVNATTLVASYTVASGQSAQSVGGTSGFTIPGGLSVTLSSGSRWVVL